MVFFEISTTKSLEQKKNIAKKATNIQLINTAIITVKSWKDLSAVGISTHKLSLSVKFEASTTASLFRMILFFCKLFLVWFLISLNVFPFTLGALS